MRIVFVIDSWNPGNGCIVTTHRLTKELMNKGHDVAIVCTEGSEASKFPGEVFIVPGFYLPGVKKAMQNMNIKFGLGVTRILKRAFRNADLVQVQFPYFMAANSVRVAKRMGIPVMGGCHIQSQNMTGAIGKDHRCLDRFLNHWFNYELFQRVDALHCPSEFAADLIKSKGSTAHFRVISNGIPRDYVPIRKTVRPEIMGDKFVILNIGRLAMEKRQIMMIDAVRKSRYSDNIQLLICGKGECADNLIQEGSSLPNPAQISYISEEEKLIFLNTADLYLHSSYVELESLSCLEAIGCGLPCLIADSPNSAAPMFALDDKLLFELDNSDDMASKIDYWYENRDRLKKLKKEALKMAEGFRMDRTVSSMERLYDDVIEHTKSGRTTQRLPAMEKQFT